MVRRGGKDLRYRYQMQSGELIWIQTNQLQQQKNHETIIQLKYWLDICRYEGIIRFLRYDMMLWLFFFKELLSEMFKKEVI